MKAVATITIDGTMREVPIDVGPESWRDGEPDLTGLIIVSRGIARVSSDVVPGGGSYHVLIVQSRHEIDPDLFAIFWDRPSELFVKASL